MRFLSVGPRICLQLPSDSTSRWTPLLFSYTFPTTWACSGLSPARARPWRANETCDARSTTKRRLTHRKYCKLSVFRRFLFCFIEQVQALHLLCRRRRLFCTYCVEFNSYNYPNILFQMLSTL